MGHSLERLLEIIKTLSSSHDRTGTNTVCGHVALSHDEVSSMLPPNDRRSARLMSVRVKG